MSRNQGKLFMLTQDQRTLNPLLETDYVTEDELQRFLATYPDLLAGDQINPEAPRRWLLVAREMGIPDDTGAPGRWSLDHLFLDQDGIPTFVECKRASDTRSRREVVAQMLDYAANGLVYWTLDDLRQAAAETALRQGTSLDEQVKTLSGGETDDDIQRFWTTVADNLRTGKLRLIFVTDETPKELRRLVEFLNTRLTDVEVLAVEIRQFRGEGHTVLAPRVIGQTESARAAKATAAPRKRPLTREEFLERCSPAARRVFTTMLEQATARGYTERWNPNSFAIRGVRKSDGGEATFAYGWLTNQNVGIWLKDLGLEPVQEAELRQHLLLHAALRSAGARSLDTEQITEHNADLILDAYHGLLQAVDPIFQHP